LVLGAAYGGAGYWPKAREQARSAEEALEAKEERL
jgi:hypothetical protein